MRSQLAILGFSATLAVACQHNERESEKPGGHAKKNGKKNGKKKKRMAPAEVFRNHAEAVVRVETPFGDATGFVVRKDGLVVTSHHLLTGERQARVVTASGRRLPVERVVASDAKSDLAVVAVAGKDLPTLELADDRTLTEGDPVIAIGNGQREHSASVTEGVVSSVDEAGSASISADALAGYGGAPVLDGDGHVVAIVNGSPQEEAGDGLTPVVSAAELSTLLRHVEPGGGETMAQFGERTGQPEGAQAPVVTLDASALSDCSVAQRERARLDLQAAVEIALPVYVIGAHEAAFRVLEGAALRLGRELDGCRTFVDALETGVGEARRQATPSEGVRILGELYEAAIELLFSDQGPIDETLKS